MFNYLKSFLFVSFILIMPYMNLSLGAMIDEKTSITHTPAVKLGKLGPEGWKDESGNYAPARFRQAADNLWDAVQKEDQASWEAGWCKARTQTYAETWNTADSCQNCVRVCAFPLCALECITLFAIADCCAGCCCADTHNTFKWDAFARQNINYIAPTIKEEEYNKKVALSTSSWKEFKEAANSSVKKPATYSGDINLEWSNIWMDCDDRTLHVGFSTNRCYTGGRRDISFVIRDTMKFVNSHGGWAHDDVFQVKVVENKIIIQ